MFIYKRKIDFYDCDPAGILFYARIFNLTHSAYEAFISSFNLEEDYWNNEDYVVPIIHSEAFYHKPFTNNDEAVIEVTVAMLKDSSFELNYFCKNQRGEKCVKAKTVHVFVDKGSWKKRRIPETVKKNFTDHLSIK
jgi:1,4-dihydroxy-2-naphthoyl-CoA hydrolase